MPKTHDVIKVVAEMGVNIRHARIAAAHTLFEKHLHPSPLDRAALADVTEPLHEAKLLQPDRRTDESETGHLLPEHRPAAKRADDFVVTHVDDPHVAFQ